jgi:hypothetical protein
MADKLIADFVRDWLYNSSNLREEVLHKELDGMKAYGLDDTQIELLRKFELPKIARRISKELGIDMDDLREAIYGEGGDAFAALGAAAYQQGVTHIRRVVPAVVLANPPNPSKVVLMGQGFKSDPTKVTVQFVTGPPTAPVPVAGVVTSISSDVDVWQRIHVDVTLTQTGDWVVQAHNDDEATTGPGGNPKWSAPKGKIHAI